MNRNEFDRLVLEIARAEYPQHRWSIEKGQLMSRAADGEKIQYTLANLYAQTPRDDSASTWLKARLAVMQNMGADIEYGDWATERANIYPLVRPVGFLTRIEQERASAPEQAIGLSACLFRWHGDLCVSAVIDKPETMVHAPVQADISALQAELVSERRRSSKLALELAAARQQVEESSRDLAVARRRVAELEAQLAKRQETGQAGAVWGVEPLPEPVNRSPETWPNQSWGSLWSAEPPTRSGWGQS